MFQGMRSVLKLILVAVLIESAYYIYSKALKTVKTISVENATSNIEQKKTSTESQTINFQVGPFNWPKIVETSFQTTFRVHKTSYKNYLFERKTQTFCQLSLSRATNFKTSWACWINISVNKLSWPHNYICFFHRCTYVRRDVFMTSLWISICPLSVFSIHKTRLWHNRLG